MDCPKILTKRKRNGSKTITRKIDGSCIRAIKIWSSSRYSQFALVNSIVDRLCVDYFGQSKAVWNQLSRYRINPTNKNSKLLI